MTGPGNETVAERSIDGIDRPRNQGEPEREHGGVLVEIDVEDSCMAIDRPRRAGRRPSEPEPSTDATTSKSMTGKQPDSKEPPQPIGGCPGDRDQYE
jgi:hypothetical protein